MYRVTYKITHLLPDELNYELRTRGILTQKATSQKQKILQRLLEKESQEPIVENVEDPYFNYEIDKKEIEKTIDNYRSLINDFEGSVQNSVYNRVQSGLAHVMFRLKYFQIPEQKKNEAVSFKNESIATCVEFDADIQSRLESDESSQPVDMSMSLPNVQSMSVFFKSVPVYKWNLKFGGKISNSSLVSFLQRVEELSIARHVSKPELFDSAVDLFAGKALVWYRAVKSQLTNWDNLVNALKREFLSPEYDEQLWNEIRTRVQGRCEPIVLYAAVMETLFGRLNKPPEELEKIKYIKRGLLAQYSNQLALMDILTVQQLTSLAKKLEDENSLRCKP